MRASIAFAAGAIAFLLIHSFSASGSVIGKITVTERQVFASSLRVGPPSADIETRRSRVYDARGAVIGYAGLVCVYIDNTSLRQCDGTYSFPGGTISLSGRMVSPFAYSLSITGGTGIYDGGAGTYRAEQQAGPGTIRRDVVFSIHN